MVVEIDSQKEGSICTGSVVAHDGRFTPFMQFGCAMVLLRN